MKKIYLLALAVIGFSANSFAQATATATATIISPITIVKDVDMNFGNIAVGAIAGTVVLPATGARTITGGVTLPTFNIGTVSAAAFTVTGTALYTYTLTLPTLATTLTSGGNTMSANAFTSSSAGTLSAGGTQSFTVGATLTVAASQAAGTYVSGTPFTVTVNYN